MKVSKALGILLLAVLLVSLPCQAATGNQGYAIYRDGVGPFNITWHTAMMVEPTSSGNRSIAQATGGEVPTGYVSYSTFLGNNTFQGVYRPFSSMSDHERDLVVATARYIAEREIEYGSTNMMNANYYNGRDRFYPNDIEVIRCDGVVEYSYEYNGIKVFGGDAWDISKNSNAEIRKHGAASLINPKTQAKSYMQRISTAKP